jgi:hypothetical protein
MVCEISETDCQGDRIPASNCEPRETKNAQPDIAIAEAALLRMKRGAFSACRTRVMIGKRARVALAGDWLR